MNVIARKTPMTLEEAVAAIAAAFADAEDKAREIKHDFRNLKDAYFVIRDAGVGIGGLESAAAAARIDALATSFYAELFAEHARQTEIAKANGIDLPVIASGGR